MQKETEFWDNVSQKGVVAHIGEGDFDVATRGFRNTDEFLKRFQGSKAYLDIGPGFGHAILKSNAQIKGVVDISMTSVKKIQEKDPTIEGYYIYDLPPTNKYDLVTCVSVAQHCDESALKNLMNFAYIALKSKGVLYIEGICMKDGLNTGHSFKNTETGSHMWNQEDIINLWPGKCIYNHLEFFNQKLNVWWLGLEKINK